VALTVLMPLLRSLAQRWGRSSYKHVAPSGAGPVRGEDKCVQSAGADCDMSLVTWLPRGSRVPTLDKFWATENTY